MSNLDLEKWWPPDPEPVAGSDGTFLTPLTRSKGAMT
jgi:hypothetical protein